MPTSNPSRANSWRTCIGCRAVDHAQDLLRIAFVSGVARPDPEATLGGRGAWVHPTSQCIANALTKRAFNRAFKGQVETGEVRALLETKEAQAALP